MVDAARLFAVWRVAVNARAGYDVLAVDDGSDTLRFDRELLLRAFGCGGE